MFNGNTRRRRVKETEEIFETIMTENPSCQIMSDTNTQIQEAQRTPSKIYAKKLHPGISFFKLQKGKDFKKS